MEQTDFDPRRVDRPAGNASGSCRRLRPRPCVRRSPRADRPGACRFEDARYVPCQRTCISTPDLESFARLRRDLQQRSSGPEARKSARHDCRDSEGNMPRDWTAAKPSRALYPLSPGMDRERLEPWTSLPRKAASPPIRAATPTLSPRRDRLYACFMAPVICRKFSGDTPRARAYLWLRERRSNMPCGSVSGVRERRSSRIVQRRLRPGAPRTRYRCARTTTGSKSVP